MRTRLAHVAIAAIAAMALQLLSACRDQKDLLAPPVRRDDIFVAITKPLFPLPDPGLQLAEITAGDYHTCVLRGDGKVYCWGMDIYGQVGVDGTETCGLNGGAGLCVKEPSYVSASWFTGSFMTATKVEAGSNHTCALDPGGFAWCWGSNFDGQVGKGLKGYVPVEKPVQVVGGLTFASLGAGGNMSCGTATAPGGLYCWGNGAASPMYLVSGGLSSISVGQGHACGNGGSNFWLCWGSNYNGQLGIDPATTKSVAPYTWLHQADGSAHVDAGGGYTCADQPNGTVQCFGRNLLWVSENVYAGLLGNPQFTGEYTFVPQTVGQSPAGAPQLHGVTTGPQHACALDTAGMAWCWGRGDAGQLGNDATGSTNAPVPVSGYTFRALAAGRDHTCGIGTDNHIYCWGSNYYGQLGNRTAPLYGLARPVKAADPM